jgi:hypothetical protein
VAGDRRRRMRKEANKQAEPVKKAQPEVEEAKAKCMLHEASDEREEGEESGRTRRKLPKSASDRLSLRSPF